MSESIREIAIRIYGTWLTVQEERFIAALEEREAAEKERVVDIIHDATAQHAADASKAMDERDEARALAVRLVTEIEEAPGLFALCAVAELRSKPWGKR